MLDNKAGNPPANCVYAELTTSAAHLAFLELIFVLQGSKLQNKLRGF
jgi:hypothetical protein